MLILLMKLCVDSWMNYPHLARLYCALLMRYLPIVNLLRSHFPKLLPNANSWNIQWLRPLCLFSCLKIKNNPV